jgi:hypothetical protein
VGGGDRQDQRPIRLAYQPPASSIFLSKQTSHQQPASSTFLSQLTSTGHQPPAKRTGCKVLNHVSLSLLFSFFCLTGRRLLKCRIRITGIKKRRALIVCLISYQSAVLFSHHKPATSNQPTVLFSQNKSAPVIIHQPNEHAAGCKTDEATTTPPAQSVAAWQDQHSTCMSFYASLSATTT